MSVVLTCSHCNNSSFNSEIWLAKLVLFNSHSSNFAFNTMVSSVSRLIVPSYVASNFLDLFSNSEILVSYDSMVSLKIFNCSSIDWINILSEFLFCSHFNNSSFNSEFWLANFTLVNLYSSSFTFSAMLSSVSRFTDPSYLDENFSDFSSNSKISFL